MTNALFLSYWLTQEDTALLAAADSLDEAGDVDRAEMIRAELELERHRLTTAEAKRYATVGPISEYRDWESLRSRLAALKAAHVGPKATGDRWDHVLCPDCEGRGNALNPEGHARMREEVRSGRSTDAIVATALAFASSQPCSVCGGSGDLFLTTCHICRSNRDASRICSRCMGTPRPVSRPLHFHRGLILVSATLEEAVEEVECGKCNGVGRETVIAGMRCPVCDGPGRWRSGVHFEHERICMSKKHKHAVTWEPGERFTLNSCSCHGTGRIQKPTPWSAALLGARRDVGILLEGKEAISHGRFPNNGYIWCRGEPSNDPGIGWFIPTWLFDLLEGGRLDPPEEAGQAPAMVYSSPESAKLQLSIAISRHLHSQIGG